MRILSFIFLCLAIGSISDDIDSFTENGLINIDLSNVEEKEVQLGDAPFKLDPEYDVEVGTMRDIMLEDEEIGKEIELSKLDPISEVEVGTMSEEELGDSLAFEHELRDGHVTDFDEFGVERSTGYSIQNEVEVGESDTAFEDLTLKSDEPITYPEEGEIPVSDESVKTPSEKWNFDTVHDVEEGTYLSDEELKKYDEEFLPKLEPFDEPDMRDIDESEVGEDPNVKGESDEESVNRIQLSQYEMDPKTEVEVGAEPDLDQWAKDVEEFGYSEPEDVEKISQDSDEVAVGQVFQDEMDKDIEKLESEDYKNDDNGEAKPLEPESGKEVGSYESEKKEFFDTSGMEDAVIVDDKGEDNTEASVKMVEAHKEEEKEHKKAKHKNSPKDRHSANEDDLSLPSDPVTEDEEAVGLNTVELKNVYKDSCGEEHFVHFDRLGDRTINPNSWYNYDFGPFQARLHGWSHTRRYANGFLCNGERGCNGKMRLQIHNVDFFQRYEFKIYMLGVPHYGMQVNRMRIETVDEPWSWVENVKWPRHCHAANKCPYARKGIVTTKRGPLVFRFHRDAQHVHISGISLRRYCGPRFQASLAARNSMPARIYEFQRVTLVVRGGDFKERMRKECNQIGMKPLCDHPHYCKHDYNSIYLGQDHHLCHYNQARSGHMPQGFKAIAGMFDSTCCYTAGHGGHRALCSRGSGHHWFAPHQGGQYNGANSFVCARYAPFTMTLQSFRNVQQRTYEFEMVQTDHYGGHYGNVMQWECARIAMKPVCDHPHYCQDHWNAVYLGQHHHLAYRPHRQHRSYFPSNFRYIWQYFDNLCAYSGHRGNALCNIPWNTHSWRHSSEYSGAFMCARAWRPEPFKRSLGARNGVPRQRWEFQPYYIDNRHGNIKDIMRRECGRVGMKPTCDHPSYCRNDYRSYYLGQNHHLEYPGHRNNKGYWPSGWMQIRHQWDGTCAYTAGHGGGNALCNIPHNTHSWRNIYSGGSMNNGGATSFVCATPASFVQKLGAKNGVPARTYEFQIVSVQQRGGSWHHLSLEECSNIGMRPICDHPHYCKNDHRSIYLGQTWHIAYPPHRNNQGLFPEGWTEIRNRWDGLCSYTGGHGGGRFLCNIPRNTHAWRHPDDDANSIMCGKIAPFTASLGPKNGVPARSYEFQMVTWKKWHGWAINDIMVQSCREIGMKPICDHPHYCKNDPLSIYIGQTHHIAYPGHRNHAPHFPNGWVEIKDNWNGICSYTAHHGHNGHRALCNINFNTHSWQHLHWGANTWMCGRIKGFTKVLGARKGVPKRRYEFRLVESNLGGVRFDKAMLAECSALGMKPICDHPHYCKNNPQSIYIGQDHHLAYKPHRADNRYWPSGFKDISHQWDGLCAFTAGHNTGALCNIPLNTHSWQKINSFANRFMCGRVAPFQAWLDAGDGPLGERRYSFRVLTTGQRGGKMSDMMKRECGKVGMKPVCDHPNYCKNDRDAIYIGQKHHISHPGHRDKEKDFPKGWGFIKNNFYGVCMYTGNAKGDKALCNYPFNSHSWRTLDDNFNTFVCGKVLRFRKKLGAKSGVPERDYTFEMVKVGEAAKGKRFSQVMIDSCEKRGMKPICDHPNYCRSDQRALYLGQTHHLTYWPHRKNNAFFPSGWSSIRQNWDGMCAYTANHGTGALCNIPKNSHSWQNPSDLANTFICGRIASLKVTLGSKNGIQGQRYEFRVIQTDVRSGKFSDVMVSECEKVGMKPICDHRSYCRNDKKSIYLGQDHHLAYPGHRNNKNFFPSGFSKVKHLWKGACTYTSNRGPPTTTLCNIPLNTHSWQKLSDKANSFVCARIAPDDDDGKATEAACQLVKGFRLTGSTSVSKKSRKKSWRRCERWCERNANMENGCQYENGNCMLLKPEADDGEFEDNYSGYGCLFTRYSDLSRWKKHQGGIKLSKDKFSATLPKGRQLESSSNLERNVIVSARMKAGSAGCIEMSLFNKKRSKGQGLTLETNGKKATAVSSGKGTSINFENNRWHEVRIASYFWGVTEYYVNGKLVDSNDKRKDMKKGSVLFSATCKNVEVKNVKIWELCGGKGVDQGEKDEHAKGKSTHDKITNKLSQCDRTHKQLQLDVINQQKNERLKTGKGNDMCQQRDSMKKSKDDMKSQRDKALSEKDEANKQQQGMEKEKNSSSSQKDSMRRESISHKQARDRTIAENNKSAAKCIEKRKDNERKSTAKYNSEEERRKGQENKLNTETKKMNHHWRSKMSHGEKVKGREQNHRAKLKSHSEQLESRIKDCNTQIQKNADTWRKKISDFEERKSKEAGGIDEAARKLSEEFKRKIKTSNELGREAIEKCKEEERKDLQACEKEKSDNDERWKHKYRKLEEFWNKKIDTERTEGGHKVQKKFNKELSRCKAVGRKEKEECKRKYNECKLEGKGYHTRMKGHEKLEKIAIKMKREADRNFAVMKTKYDAKLDRYNTCVRETEELDRKHAEKHAGMQSELEGHLIQHAACMQRHKQSLKLIENYKNMFRMIRTHVSQLRTQQDDEYKRARELQKKLLAYKEKCGELEKGWRIKYDVKEHKAITASNDRKAVEKEYKHLDLKLRKLDKKYKWLQKTKEEDEKTWLGRITKAKKDLEHEKELERKKIEDRKKRWEAHKKKLKKNTDETHDEYNARVAKAHAKFLDEEKAFEKKWQAIVHKISRKTGETVEQFRARVNRSYKKYRQVSDYVGRFKQARKQHREDIAKLKEEFEKQDEDNAKMLKDYSTRLRRWSSKADEQKAKLVEAVRRQDRHLREAKKAKLKAERARKDVKRAQSEGEGKVKTLTEKSLELKKSETNFDSKWKSKVDKNEDRLEEKHRKTHEYWTKRFDIEKKAIAGATKEQISKELHGIMEPRYKQKITELKTKTVEINKDTASKVRGWETRISTKAKEYKHHIAELEKGTQRDLRQAKMHKDLQKENDQLKRDITKKCGPVDGESMSKDNHRLRELIVKHNSQIEEVRDKFESERKVYRMRKEKNKKEIKDLTVVAAHLQEKLEQIRREGGWTSTESSTASKEAHDTSKASEITTNGHSEDSEPFYTQLNPQSQ